MEADIHMEDDRKSVSDGKSKTIRYCVLYLSPKDYHRFHAPVDFELQTGRHFPGEVLPVNPWLSERFSDLFSVNERVVLSGKYAPC